MSWGFFGWFWLAIIREANGKEENMALDNDQPMKEKFKPTDALVSLWESPIQDILPPCISCVSTRVGVINVFQILIILFLTSLSLFSVPILTGFSLYYP